MSPPVAPPSLPRDTLPVGFRLMDYDVEGVLGVGGFGIVYRAREANLQRTVAIKEYLPATLAVRAESGEVVLRSPAHAEAFALGLQSFVNEARLLARFDHPSLVRVFRFWEANGTAYMVMPCYEGPTLYAARKAMDLPPPEAWLRALMDPLLGALDCLHREQVFHRDVAPDNILIVPDRDSPEGFRPVLLDFGAARRVITDHTQSLTAILKPSFAPIEQYAETTTLRQGPWTDLYGLGAVLHYCITGRTPVPATARAVHDDLAPLAGLAAGLAHDFQRQYADALLATIDQALAIRPEHRLGSVAQWRARLLNEPLPPLATTLSPTRGPEPTHSAPPPPDPDVFAPTLQIHRPPTEAEGQVADLAVAAPGQVRRSTWWWGGLAAGLAVLVAVSVGRVPWRSDAKVVDASTESATVSAPPVVSVGASAAAGTVSAARMAPAPARTPTQAPAASRTASTDVAKPAPAAEPAERSRSAGAGSPKEACGNRVFIAQAICMKRQCAKPRFTQHPQCVKLREQEAAHRRGMDGGF